MSENPLLLKEGRLRPRRRGWFLQATDHLNHPACSQGSQAPLLQKEGIFGFEFGHPTIFKSPSHPGRFHSSEQSQSRRECNNRNHRNSGRAVD